MKDNEQDESGRRKKQKLEHLDLKSKLQEQERNEERSVDKENFDALADPKSGNGISANEGPSLEPDFSLEP